jgi:hypothetical protein
MANKIKYSVGAETLALKKGNFYLGVDDVSKGPTSSTGYWNTIVPPVGGSGYSVYLNKASNGPSIYCPASDAQLISLTNTIAGQNYTTVQQAFNYYFGQSDKMVVNKNYETIPTNGLVLNFDPGFVPSFPQTGTAINDLSLTGYSATLVNGPTYESVTGSLVYDGTNDETLLGSRNGASFTDTDNMTISVFLKINNKNIVGVLGRFIGSASSDGWTIWVYQSAIKFFNTNTSNNYDPDFIGVGYGFTDGQWFHYSVVRDLTNNRLTIYVNGAVQQQFTTTSTSYKKTNNGISFGSLGGANFMNGNIGQCLIYNRSLSASEIQTIYYKGSIVTSGLVFLVDAANDVSYPGTGTVWRDLSTSQINGTLTNGPVYDPGGGGSIVFDGSNDNVTLTNNSNFSPGTGDFTYSSWIYPSSWAGTVGWSPLFVVGVTNGLWIGKNPSGQFILRAYGVADRLAFNTSPTLNTWTQVTITRIGTLASLYYNGVLQTTSTTSQNFAQATAYIATDGISAWFSGRIANTFFYKNKGLSASEVLQNFNAQRGRFGV